MDIVAIGEPLMELSDIEGDGRHAYLPGFGGDTSNFLIAAARQEAETAYFTRIGTDTFGKRFMDLWKTEGIDTSAVIWDEAAHTGLYFITYVGKEHSFTYMRKGSAASQMTPSNIPKTFFKGTRLLHVSGISQAISDTACDTIFEAVRMAKSMGVLVSYDPNLRLKLWGLDRARAIIHATVPSCDIFMPSYDDVTALTGLFEPEKIVDFYHRLGAPIVVLKLGKKGVLVSNVNERIMVSGWVVATVDQTGAGDTFDGAFCAQYLRTGNLAEAARYANAAAALSTMGHGAVTPIPRRPTVEEFLSAHE